MYICAIYKHIKQNLIDKHKKIMDKKFMNGSYMRPQFAKNQIIDNT